MFLTFILDTFDQHDEETKKYKEKDKGKSKDVREHIHSAILVITGICKYMEIVKPKTLQFY